MRRNYYNELLTLLLAFSLLFAACKKGDTGPAGAAGAAGQPGAPGAAGGTGPQGPKGDTGTANVIYSQWMDVQFTPVIDTTGGANDTVGYFSDIAAPRLDSAMLTNGEIKVYLNFGSASDPDVVPLPFIFPLNSGFSGTAYINPDFFIGDIQLTSNVDPSTVTQTGVKFQQYRYILVPGSVVARSLKPNWKDYNAVKAFYGIKDY
jgi:hypothetical protein